MIGAFELFHDGNLSFRFSEGSRWDGRGGIRPVPGQGVGCRGIRVVRECAGMGLITDLCPMPGGSHEGLVRTV